MIDLPQPPKPNCVPHFFCECCALCQEYRELKSRGWDPSVGKQNEEQEPAATTMTPPVTEKVHAL
ncbi:hypothetical protein WN944_014103 [Citrus x changshan-huyou]|uniref:Uncharacterized protein n=1 Tax=Citrus x changshan-huyou TaxID=2935761 RepID=A0AAP0M6G9_9ROSI